MAVAVGGLAGAGLRAGIDLALPHGATSIAWSTLLINVVGSFVLGWLVGAAWPRIPPWAQAGLGPGLLGTFTTFSGIAVLILGGDPLLGLVEAVAGVLVGVLAAWLGVAIGSPRRSRR